MIQSTHVYLWVSIQFDIKLPHDALMVEHDLGVVEMAQCCSLKSMSFWMFLVLFLPLLSYTCTRSSSVSSKIKDLQVWAYMNIVYINSDG